MGVSTLLEIVFFIVKTHFFVSNILIFAYFLNIKTSKQKQRNCILSRVLKIFRLKIYKICLNSVLYKNRFIENGHLLVPSPYLTSTSILHTFTESKYTFICTLSHCTLSKDFFQFYICMYLILYVWVGELLYKLKSFKTLRKSRPRTSCLCFSFKVLFIFNILPLLLDQFFKLFIK